MFNRKIMEAHSNHQNRTKKGFEQDCRYFTGGMFPIEVQKAGCYDDVNPFSKFLNSIQWQTNLFILFNYIQYATEANAF